MQNGRPSGWPFCFCGGSFSKRGACGRSGLFVEEVLFAQPSVADKKDGEENDDGEKGRGAVTVFDPTTEAESPRKSEDDGYGEDGEKNGEKEEERGFGGMERFD